MQRRLSLSQSSLETEGDTFKRQMDLNFMGVVRTVRAALRGLLERDSGALVLVSSGWL